MRYVFFSLLLANIGFFAWQQFREPNETDHGAPESRRLESENTVYLLSERGDDAREEELSQMVNQPLVKLDSDQPGCLAAGPFEDMFVGQDVVEQLASLDLDPDLRAVDRTTDDSDYRVMIPPASSLQNAFRKLRELKAREIDSYVITRGPDALGISLGVFSTREGAESLAETRRKSGYQVEISEIQRLDREYWIFSSSEPDLEVPSAVWRSVKESHPDLELKRMACSK